MRKFTVTRFIREFSTNRACLDYLRDLRWPNGIRCKKCKEVTEHYCIVARKCYECKACGTQVYPTAGTIFHKSRTPLTVWFYVVYQMAQTRSGVSAKEIERETGVTYKTAWRMCQLVRAALASGKGAGPFTGEVEVDETYIGGKPRYDGQKRRKTWVEKVPLVGIVERDTGDVRTFIVPHVRSLTMMPLIKRNVAKGAAVYTDEAKFYQPLAKRYEHSSVGHRRMEYARQEIVTGTGEVRNVHTNTVEGFFSHVKGGITTVHKGVDRKYLHRYADEFAFRYSRRNREEPMFNQMLCRIAGAGRLSARLP